MTFSVPRMVDNWQCLGFMKSMKSKKKNQTKTKPFSVPMVSTHCWVISDPSEVRVGPGRVPTAQHAVSQGPAGHQPSLVLLLKSSWLRAPVLVPLPRGWGRAAAAQHVSQKIIVFLPAASQGPRYHRHLEERFALHLLPCAKHTQS